MTISARETRAWRAAGSGGADRHRRGLGFGQASSGPSPAFATEGAMTEAVRAFLAFPFNDEEVVVVDEAGYFEATGRHVPTLLNQLSQTMRSEGPALDDPAVLGAISAPLLVLHGSGTRPVLAAGARHVADHVRNATLRELAGAGHAPRRPTPRRSHRHSPSSSRPPSSRPDPAPLLEPSSPCYDAQSEPAPPLPFPTSPETPPPSAPTNRV